MLNIESIKNARNAGVRDFIALAVLIAIISLFNFNAQQLSAPIQSLQDQVNLDWKHLPKYAILTVMRMFLAAIIAFI